MSDMEVINWVYEKFPKECRHMMRLWIASWKISRVLTILALFLIAAPSAYLGSKIFGNNIQITNNMPTPIKEAPAESKKESMRLSSTKCTSYFDNITTSGAGGNGMVFIGGVPCGGTIDSHDNAKNNILIEATPNSSLVNKR